MKDIYESPLNSRYASQEMQKLFSPDEKFKTWRKLWIALAEAEKELGLNITEEQIKEMIKSKDDINYETAEAKEREVRHDVMAHILAYGEQCPKAKGIIHLGATSCYVGDNTDIIIMTQAMILLRSKMIMLMKRLSDFALKYKSMPTLGYTHLQPAQLVTVGKRACLWLQDILTDYEDLEYILSNMKLLGSKGTTGTQASFLELFDGNEGKVLKLEKLIAEKMGFKDVYPVTGQTYPRKTDSRVLNILSGIAQSAGKFSSDIRILQSMKEIEEPFEKEQIGSSAMAYKRNPMRSERMASLARYVMVDALNPAITSSGQWLERTLDDSANRRISIPEAFLAVDAILNIYINVAENLVVYPKVIEKHIEEELPFMATENILMEMVKRGGDRQELHEKIRLHSIEAGKKVKVEGKKNDLIERILNDKAFTLTENEIRTVLKPENYIGRAPSQVDEFIAASITPILKANKDLKETSTNLRV